MSASFRALLPCGNSCSRALLRLLSGLLSRGGFGGGALLGLLSGGLLSRSGFSGGALLGLLASCGFSRRTLLRSTIGRR